MGNAFGMIPGLEPDEWSNDACRGYVIMAMEDCGFSKKDIRRVVGQLYEVFDLNSVEDAKEKYLSSLSRLSRGEMSKDGTQQVPPFELSPASGHVGPKLIIAVIIFLFSLVECV